MKNSQFTEISPDEYVDKSLVPGTVIRLASSSDPDRKERLLLVTSYPAPLRLFGMNFEIPISKQRSWRQRAKQIEIGPKDLSCLDRSAWVDCTEPDEEFAYESVRSTLIAEPERIVGNLRKEIMRRINDAIGR